MFDVDMMLAPLFGKTIGMTLTDVWENVDDFINDYNNSEIPVTISMDNAKLLYYLLYAQYDSRSIASSDVNQFKYQILTNIFKYGPTWEKKLEVQQALRDMSLDELQESAKAIYNHSYNPSTAPTTDTLEELNTINDQNVTKHKRSKLDAYALLSELLERDVTSEFVRTFEKYFSKVGPTLPLWYTTDID